MPTYRFIVKGFVQGVGYRYFVKKVANRMDIKGYVRNLDDGTVEVVATLEDNQFNQFLLELNRGSAFSKVREVEYEQINDMEFEDFEIRS